MRWHTVADLTRKRWQGQAIVLMALGIVVFLGFVALSIDGGMLYSTRRRAQAAADSAALAAAYARVADGDWQQAAWDVASQNGFSAANGDVIQVTCETESGGICPSVWDRSETEYLRVSITATRTTFFAQVVAHSALKTTVEAVARVRVDKQPLFSMDAYIALAPHESPGIKLNSNVDLQINGGGMFSNSDSATKSIWALGTTVIQLDEGQTLKGVGGVNVAGVVCGSASGEDCIVEGMEQVDFPPTDYLSQRVPAMPSAPACTDNVRGGDLEDFNGGTLGGDGVHKVYCIDGDVSLEDIDIKGDITFVMTDRDADVKFDDDVNVEHLDIFMEDGQVRFLAGVNFHAQHFHVFASGDADVNILGNTNVQSEDTLFYLNEGVVDWNGNASVKFCGPPEDDPRGFGGLAIYMVHNDSNLHINGNTENWIAGTVLAPYAEVTYNGNSDNIFNTVACHGLSDSVGYPTQVIAYTLQFNGNSYNRVDFNTDFLFTANAPVIELVK